MSSTDRRAQEQRLEKLSALIHEVEALPEGASKRSASEAIAALLDLHGAGLERVLSVLGEAGEPGQALIERLGRDEVVSGLLILHGLHPTSLRDRVLGALDRVRPYMESHGGSVTLLAVEETTVRLRLEGSCHGCASSLVTIKYAIEQEIAEAAPEVESIDVEGLTEPKPAGFVPLTDLKRTPRPTEAGAWRPLAALDRLGPDQLLVEDVDGVRLLLCRLGEQPFAYRDGCPACGGSLAGTGLEAGRLSCAGCGHAYDVRQAGRCLDDPALHLEPLPLLLREGEMKVALAAAR